MPISPSHPYSKRKPGVTVISQSLWMKTEKATTSTVIRKALHVNNHNSNSLKTPNNEK